MRQWRLGARGTEDVLVLMGSVVPLAEPKVYAAAYRQLPRFRQKKADSLMLERDRRLSAGAWLLLEQAFSREGFRLSDYPIGYLENGKPYAEGCLLHFSLSHSGEFVMCAVSRTKEVGCDIQRFDSYEAGLARACMASRELEKIEALPSASQRAHAFCRHWVAKESYMKALGCGLIKDPASFAVDFRDGKSPGSHGGIQIFDGVLANGVDVFELDAPEGYCAAACALDVEGIKSSVLALPARASLQKR